MPLFYRTNVGQGLISTRRRAEEVEAELVHRGH
jgi:hypothetical protein